MVEPDGQSAGRIYTIDNYELKHWLYRAGSRRRELLAKLKDNLLRLGLSKRRIRWALVQLTSKTQVVLDRRLVESCYTLGKKVTFPDKETLCCNPQSLTSLEQTAQNKHRDDVKSERQSENTRDTSHRINESLMARITDDSERIDTRAAVESGRSIAAANAVKAFEISIPECSASKQNESRNVVQKLVRKTGEKGSHVSSSITSRNDKDIYAQRSKVTQDCSRSKDDLSGENALQNSDREFEKRSYHSEGKITASSKDKLTSMKTTDVPVRQRRSSSESSSSETIASHFTHKLKKCHSRHKSSSFSEDHSVPDKKRSRDEKENQEPSAPKIKSLDTQTRVLQSKASDESNVIASSNRIISESEICSKVEAKSQIASTSKMHVQTSYVGSESLVKQADPPLTIPVNIDLTQIDIDSKLTNCQEGDSSFKINTNYKARKVKKCLDEYLDEDVTSPKKLKREDEMDISLSKNLTVDNSGTSDDEKFSEIRRVDRDNVKTNERRTDREKTEQYAENRKYMHYRHHLLSSEKKLTRRKGSIKKIKEKFRELFGNPSKSENEQDCEILTMYQNRKGEFIQSSDSEEVSLDKCYTVGDIVEKMIENTFERNETSIKLERNVENVIPLENISNDPAVVDNAMVVENAISESDAYTESSPIGENTEENINEKNIQNEENVQQLLLSLYEKLTKEIGITFEKILKINTQNAAPRNLQENGEPFSVESASSEDEDINLKSKLLTTPTVEVTSEEKGAIDLSRSCDVSRNIDNSLLINNNSAMKGIKNAPGDCTLTTTLTSTSDKNCNPEYTESLLALIDTLSKKKTDKKIADSKSAHDAASDYINDIAIEINIKSKSESGYKFSLKIPMFLIRTFIDTFKGSPDISKLGEFFGMILKTHRETTTHRNTSTNEENNLLEVKKDITTGNTESTSDTQQVVYDSSLASNAATKPQSSRDDTALGNDRNATKRDHADEDKHMQSERKIARTVIEDSESESNNVLDLRKQLAENSSGNKKKADKRVASATIGPGNLSANPQTQIPGIPGLTATTLSHDTPPRERIQPNVCVGPQCCASFTNPNTSSASTSSAPFASSQSAFGIPPPNINFAANSISAPTADRRPTEIFPNSNEGPKHQSNLEEITLKNVCRYLENCRNIAHSIRINNEQQLLHQLEMNMFLLFEELIKMKQLYINDFVAVLNYVVSRLNYCMLQNHPTSFTEIIKYIPPYIQQIYFERTNMQSLIGNVLCHEGCVQPSSTNVDAQQFHGNVLGVPFSETPNVNRPQFSGDASNIQYSRLQAPNISQQQQQFPGNVANFPRMSRSKQSAQPNASKNVPFTARPTAPTSNQPLRNNLTHGRQHVSTNDNVLNVNEQQPFRSNIPFTSLPGASTSNVNVHTSFRPTIPNSTSQTFTNRASAPRMTTRIDSTATASIINAQQQSQMYSQRPFIVRPEAPIRPSTTTNLTNATYQTIPNLFAPRFPAAAATNTRLNQASTTSTTIGPGNLSANPQKQIPQMGPGLTATTLSHDVPKYTQPNMYGHSKYVPSAPQGSRSTATNSQYTLSNSKKEHTVPDYFNSVFNIFAEMDAQQDRINPTFQQYNLQQNVPVVPLVNSFVPFAYPLNLLTNEPQTAQPKSKTNVGVKESPKGRPKKRLAATTSTQNASQEYASGSRTKKGRSQNTTSEVVREISISQQSNVSQNMPSVASSDYTTKVPASSSKTTTAQAIAQQRQMADDTFHFEFLTDIQKIILRNHLYQYFNISTDLCKHLIKNNEAKKLDERNVLHLLLISLDNYIKKKVLKLKVFQEPEVQESKMQSSSSKSAKTQSKPNQNIKNSATCDKNLEGEEHLRQRPSGSTYSNTSMNPTSATTESNLTITESQDKEPPATGVTMTKNLSSEIVELQKQNKDTPILRYSIQSLLEMKEIENVETVLGESLKIPEQNLIAEEKSRGNSKTETQNITKIDNIVESLRLKALQKKQLSESLSSPAPNTSNASRDISDDKTDDQTKEQSDITKSNVNVEKHNLMEVQNINKNTRVIMQEDNVDNDIVSRSLPCDVEDKNKKDQDKEECSNNISSENSEGGVQQSKDNDIVSRSLPYDVEDKNKESQDKEECSDNISSENSEGGVQQSKLDPCKFDSEFDSASCTSIPSILSNDTSELSATKRRKLTETSQARDTSCEESVFSECGLKIDRQNPINEQTSSSVIEKTYDESRTDTQSIKQNTERSSSDSQEKQHDNVSFVEEDKLNISQNISNAIKHELMETPHQLRLLNSTEVDSPNSCRSSVIKAPNVKFNEQSSLKTEEMQPQKISSLDISEDTSSITEKSKMRSIDIVKQYENTMEEKKSEPEDHEEKRSEPEDREEKKSEPEDREEKRSEPEDREEKRSETEDREEKKSEPEDDEKSEASYISVVKESDCLNGKEDIFVENISEAETADFTDTEDYEIIDLSPSILNVRSISPSLFEKLSGTLCEYDQELLTVKEIEEKLSHLDNARILDEEGEEEKEEEDKACLRCNRKSTVCCGNCLVAYYCSERCSFLHWQTDHYKHCKPHDMCKPLEHKVA